MAIRTTEKGIKLLKLQNQILDEIGPVTNEREG